MVSCYDPHGMRPAFVLYCIYNIIKKEGINMGTAAITVNGMAMPTVKLQWKIQFASYRVFTRARRV